MSCTRELATSESELVERLERLERLHQRLKGFALAALALATAIATIYATQPVPQMIDAHMFRVVDDSGKVRASMTVVSGGSAIGLTDAQGNARALMILDPSKGASILLSDAAGKLRTTLNVTPEGNSVIGISDPQGFEMDLGSTKIAMFGNDTDRSIRALLQVLQDGAPSIALSDSQGFELHLGKGRTITPRTGQAQIHACALDACPENHLSGKYQAGTSIEEDGFAGRIPGILEMNIQQQVEALNELVCNCLNF